MIFRPILAAALLALFVPAHAASISLQAEVTQMAPTSVPRGAQRVPFLSIELHADCDDDVAIRALTLKRTGLGRAADIERVYAFEGANRVTRAAMLNRSGEVSLRFPKGLVVKACAKRTLVIAADIDAEADSGGQHAFRLASVTSNGLNVHIVEAGPTRVPGSITPSSVGAVSVTVEGANTPLRYGSNRTLARVRLEADGEVDQEIHSILLTNDGKATDKDLRNLRLENRKGTALTGIAAAMDGDAVRLTFDPPLRLDRNDEMLLELKGDIRASNRRTVRFVIEEPSDLEAFPAAR